MMMHSGTDLWQEMLQDVVRTLYLDDINDIIILLAQCFSVVTFTLNSSIKDNGFCVCVCVCFIQLKHKYILRSQIFQGSEWIRCIVMFCWCLHIWLSPIYREYILLRGSNSCHCIVFRGVLFHACCQPLVHEHQSI